MSMENFNTRQIWSAQKLSQYNFQINYYQWKANENIDSFPRFCMKNQVKKDNLTAENTQILDHL